MGRHATESKYITHLYQNKNSTEIIYLQCRLHPHHPSLFWHQTSSLNQQKSTCIGSLETLKKHIKKKNYSQYTDQQFPITKAKSCSSHKQACSNAQINIYSNRCETKDSSLSQYTHKLVWVHVENWTTTYNAFFLPLCQFSQISPAIVRPLPTPAPSPIKNPALVPFGRCCRCLCHGNQYQAQKY